MRQTLCLVSLVLVAAVMAGGCGQSSRNTGDAAADQRIAGAWRAKVQFDSGPFAAVKDLEFLYVFNAGGTMMESSNYDAAPPVPPAYGVWRSLGHNRYELRYEFYMTRVPDSSENLSIESGWLPAGRGVFVDTVTLSSDGKSFVSRAHYAPYDPEGNPVEGAGAATIEGGRVDF